MSGEAATMGIWVDPDVFDPVIRLLSSGLVFAAVSFVTFFTPGNARATRQLRSTWRPSDNEATA
jgi:hypothetical protein